MSGLPYNETSVIQVALNLLGFPLIQSIDAGGPAAQAMHNVYAPLLASDLSSPNWRFATKTAVLSQIAGVDPGYAQWNTAYQLPADMLALWSIWPSVPYNIFGQQLWTTGTQEIQIMYRHVCPPNLLPPSYVWYFCYLLAVTVSPGVTTDPKITAQLEAAMNKWRSQAMVVNSQNKPNQGIANSPWVGSRKSGWYGNVGDMGGGV